MSNMGGFELLLRFIHILVSRKRTILFIVLIPTVICTIVVFALSSSYRSLALIKPPQTEGVSPLDLLKESGGGGGLSSLLGGSQTGADDCMSILGSARFARVVIKRFDLETLYKFKKEEKAGKKYYFADLIKQFQAHTKFELTMDEDAIKISMEDESPDRAREMVSYMVFALDSLYSDIQRTAIQHRLEYVDHRLVLAEEEMKKMEDSLVSFQKRHNLIAPEAQVKIILENTIKTEVEIETLKEQLALEKALRGNSSARYQDLSVQKELLEKTLMGQLRNSSDSNTLMLPAHTLPVLATQYFRLERAYTIRLGVFKYLVQQVEALKLEANKNVQVISVIDPPWTDNKRVSPKRRIMVEAVFILSLIFGIVVVVLQAAWRGQVNPENLKLISEIKRGLLKF